MNTKEKRVLDLVYDSINHMSRPAPLQPYEGICHKRLRQHAQCAKHLVNALSELRAGEMDGAIGSAREAQKVWENPWTT